MDPYENISDEDFENYQVVESKNRIEKRFENRKNKSKKVDYKNIIITSFANSVICPIMQLTSAICERHGVMFDYKNANCKNGIHRHKTLTVFLGCCGEYIKILNYVNGYAYRIDTLSHSITKQRFHVHFTESRKEDFKSHLELLIVNLFPLKVTIPVSDLKEIFKYVYNSDINLVLREKGIYDSFEKVIHQLLSPNLFITVSAKRENITCIPTSHPEYIIQNKSGMRYALDAEENIFSKKKEIKITTKQNDYKKSEILSLSKIFNTDIPKLADFNVPRSLQKLQMTNKIFKDVENPNGFNKVYFITHENLRIENEDVHFDIPDID